MWFRTEACATNSRCYRTDFQHQLEGDNALDFDMFTIIAVELPGWGRSRPPIRKYGTGVYENDAQCLYELMKELGFNKYSILSWSDGTKVALLMATLYPQSVESLITKLKQTISRSSIYRFPNGEHNCHQKYATIFKDVVEDYLMGRLKDLEEDVDPNKGPNDGMIHMKFTS
ncbi:unnamed protein product [Oppiella nova]|uniref:AB hydrolase-1 domain-containing protein n=1 Tax=Oppiella nova TaxID=334625 RepID=A0A7R9M3I7_9ACAR|nr:unnamed protein product [Oppiella nova]CAG2170093.1 unnamed protein product [Oppiella nova]